MKTCRYRREDSLNRDCCQAPTCQGWVRIWRLQMIDVSGVRQAYVDKAARTPFDILGSSIVMYSSVKWLRGKGNNPIWMENMMKYSEQ